MVKATIPVGRVAVATPRTMAIALREPTEAQEAAMDLFRPVASEVVASDPALKDAARELVQERVAAEDLVTGESGRALPEEFRFERVPASTGYVLRFVYGGRVIGGWKVDGTLSAVLSDGTSDPTVVAQIKNIIQEWWIRTLDGVAQRNLGWYSTAGLAEAGQVVAIDIDDWAGVDAVQVGTTIVDDHCVPSRLTLRRGGIMQWQPHGVGPTPSTMHLVVAAGSGRAATFAGRPVFDFTVGLNVSYGQPWDLEHLETPTTDTVEYLIRNGPNWSLKPFLIDWPTSTPSAAGPLKGVISFTEQPYITTARGATNAQGERTVRFAVGYNPTAARHELYLLDYNKVTGVITDIRNPERTHDTNSGGYLSDSLLTPALGPTGSGTRRLCDVRPATAGGRGVLTIEYTGAVGPTGVITETLFDDAGNITGTRTFGQAGQHLERYPGGASYASDGAVWHINESGGVYTLSREGVPVKRSTTPMFRGFPAPPGGPVECFVSVAGKYVDYNQYSETALLAIRRAA